MDVVGEGVAGFASEATWLVNEGDVIRGAFVRMEDAIVLLESDTSYSMCRAPAVLAVRRFSWGVVGPSGHLVKLHGGDCRSATAQAVALDAEIKLFLQ